MEVNIMNKNHDDIINFAGQAGNTTGYIVAALDVKIEDDGTVTIKDEDRELFKKSSIIFDTVTNIPFCMDNNGNVTQLITDELESRNCSIIRYILENAPGLLDKAIIDFENKTIRIPFDDVVERTIIEISNGV